MIHVIWGSDYHLGLRTDEIDREAEIIGVFKQQIARAIELKDAGKKVVFVFGGDIFNKNNPPEDLISRFIAEVINPIKESGIDAYFIVGNHDSISVIGNTSCLNFIDKIRVGYPNIRLVSDITCIKLAKTEYGPLYFTFLPHITRVHLDGSDYKNTQDYIDARCQKIFDKIGPDGQHYVFSHLNVRGAHPGSEENLLKKSEVYLPTVFTQKTDVNIDPPEIIQGHIHTKDIIGNINIVGSPIYCGFGEGESPKYYLELKIPTAMGEKGEHLYHLTDHVTFTQLELDLSQDWDGVDFLSHPEVKTFLASIPEGRAVLKFDLKVNPKNCSVNWDDVRTLLMEQTGHYIKVIKPKYIYDRIVRSSKQTIKLSREDAVKTFLQNNKPPLAKEKYRLALTYMAKAKTKDKNGND